MSPLPSVESHWPPRVATTLAAGSGGHESETLCGGGQEGRRCARVHPDYGSVVERDDVGIFIGASSKVRHARSKLLFFLVHIRTLQAIRALVAVEMGN